MTRYKQRNDTGEQLLRCGSMDGRMDLIEEQATTAPDEVSVMRIRCIIGSFSSFTYKSKCRLTKCTVLDIGQTFDVPFCSIGTTEETLAIIGQTLVSRGQGF